MRRIQVRLEVPRKEMSRRRKHLNLVSIPIELGVIAALATAYFRSSATPYSLNVGIGSLITVNAVVVGLTYATMRKAASLTEKTDERATFTLGVLLMVTGSMIGVLLGIVHLVWSPSWPVFMPIAVGFLVIGPTFVPVLARQEHRAVRAQEESAVETWLEDLAVNEANEVKAADESVQGIASPLRVRRCDFTADPSNPFANDALGREPQVKAFCSVVAGAEAPAILAVDAGWGAGKTAFLKMCAAWMRSDDFLHGYGQMTVVEFNAWSQNYTDAALADIVNAITFQITDSDEQRTIAADMLRRQTVKLASGGLLNDQLLAMEGRPHREVLTFKKTLRAYAARTGGKLIVLVDELDRCQPNYAMAVLERLRHIFDVKDVLVVLAVNQLALNRAVVAHQGLQDLEGETEPYLRRFVDQTIWIPAPDDSNIAAFIEYRCNETGLDKRLEDEALTKPIFDALIGLHNNSLRYIEQTIQRVTVVFASIPTAWFNLTDGPEHTWLRIQAAMTLMILRELDRDLYASVIQSATAICDAGRILHKAGLNASGEVLHRMEVVLLLAACDEPYLSHEREFWQSYRVSERKAEIQALKDEFEEILDYVQDERPSAENLSNIIEMTYFHPNWQTGSRFALDGKDGRLMLLHHRLGELTGTSGGEVDEDRVTVVAEPENPKATVRIEPPDAQPDAPGHQVDLPADEDTPITVTTISDDGKPSVFRFIAQRSTKTNPFHGHMGTREPNNDAL